MEPILKSHPDERPTPLERQLDNANLNMNVLSFTPEKGLPLLKGHISGENEKRWSFKRGFTLYISSF